MGLRKKLKNNRFAAALWKLSCRWFGGNRFAVPRSSHVSIDGAMRRVRVKISGDGNFIRVAHPRYICDMRIFINGSNNRIEIDEDCLLKDLTLWIEDDNNRIHIAAGTVFAGGGCQLNCIEGTELRIGKQCLFASNVNIRTGDSHSVLDASGNRINPSLNIHIGDHVWFGQNVTVLKGAAIGNDCICATGAIVTKKFPGNVILAGCPARIVKENISWCHERI